MWSLRERTEAKYRVNELSTFFITSAISLYDQICGTAPTPPPPMIVDTQWESESGHTWA